MKTIDKFLSDLYRLDVKLWVEGDRLRCNAPEEVLTPELSAQISDRKAEIIAFLEVANLASTSTSDTIQPIAREGNLPLSFAQQRLWFLQQLEPNNPFYNEHGAIQLTGILDVAALEQSLNQIVQRHEALRTTFKMVEGQPVQIIAPSLTLTLPVVNLCQLPEAQQQMEGKRLATEQSQRPFDLIQGPLLRWTLLQLGEQEHVLLFTMHHIISDGWSLTIIVRELSALYQAFSTGKPSPLPELPIQYADFAVWQRQKLQGEKLSSQLSYWKQQLNDAPPLLPLPTDRPRPPVQTYRGATQSLRLPKSLTQALQAITQKAKVTLFMTLLAAFKLLLYRYSGQEDIIVGSPIANRNRAEIEGLIGFFVNALVLRTDISGNPTFEELLARVRKVTMGAYEHQDLPFEKLVEELQPERDANYNPLFQVSFALHNTPKVNFELPGLTLTHFEVEHTRALFDLRLSMTETDSGLEGFWEYNTDLFDAATINRMSGHLQTLLEAIAAHPQQRVDQLPLLTEAQQHQLLTEWNQTQTDYPSNQCIHQLFEAQVEKTPDAVAVVFENQQLTYQQLNQRANQLAHHLLSLGVKAEVLVGICMERSLEMVVGLLGILKAGGAYVPLDPSYPQERLSCMLADSGVEVLLTQRSLLESLPEHQAEVVCLDTDWEAIEQYQKENREVGVRSDNLAYVIYTSGSTGKPKGVLVEHKNVVRLFAATQSWYHFNANDVWTNFHSIAFDFSVWEIWGALVYGGRLVIVPYWLSREPQSFYDLLCSEKVTVLNQTPSAFRQLINVEKSDTRQPQLSLRLVIFGGEALELQSLKPWFERHGDRSPQLVNMYGITETTVHVTYRPLTIKDLNSSGSVIGRPIPDLQMYILDDNLQLVPIGVKGQMYVGGAGLARGYLNRQQLTWQRFIPNPFNHQREGRLYKTGDLARYLPNGDIEYLGRLDHQVKIRGFRIELGEIEAALVKHPVVRETIVLAREDNPGNKRLVAYVVPNLDDQNSNAQTCGTESQTEQISQWQQVFNETYSQPTSEPDSTFNIIGWNDSYTGQPIPQQQMRQWVDYTVEQILSQHPKRVLEIGCGTGLLLLRIAPHCSHYLGTDISQASLDYIEQQIRKSQGNWSHVNLCQKTADDFEGIEQEAFDTVILNSVVQYFPSIDYLVAVLEGAVQAVKPGGFIFVGDVRSLPLLEALHADIELHKASYSLPRKELWQRVQKNLKEEQELVIDPAFFTALKQHIPQISHVQIQLQRGRYHNELSRFRYEVILQVGGEVSPAVEPEFLDWYQAQLTLPEIRQRLLDTQPEILVIRRVPNARVQTQVKLVELMTSDEELATVGDLQEALAEITQENGIDPEAFWELSHELAYEVYVNWSDAEAPGCYDVVFQQSSPAPMPKRVLPILGEASQVLPWSTYANNPLQGKLIRQLVPQLRSFVKQILPEYMIPSAFVVLEALPLTPNGKVDRKALSAIDAQRPELNTDFVAPRTLEEELLAQIWSEVLGVEQVGIYDNFFELGGDSLLSVRVLAKANKSGLEFSLQQLYENQTINDIVKIIQKSDLSESIVKTAPFSLISSEERQFLPNGVEDAYPLTKLQLGMLFHSEYAPETAVYHDVYSYHLKAPMNVPIFHSTLEQIVAHHPVLRTSIAITQFAQPLQLVHSQVNIELTVEDISSLQLDEQERNIATWIEQDKQRPFIWDAPPLARFHIHQRSNDTFNFTFSFHHAILDGWSVATLMTELVQHYFLLLGETVPPLKAAPNLTFRDYVALEQKTLQSQECQQYWHEKLADLTVTKLPRLPDTQQREPVEQVTKQEVEISPTLSAQLKQFAIKVGVPLKSVLLAAHIKVMSFLSNQADITTGVVMHGRPAVEDSERVLGLFLNTMPWRMQLSGGTWVELVEQTFAQEQEALPFQQYPLAQLQKEVGLGQPLFETAFNYTNFHVYQGLSGVDNLGVLGGQFVDPTNFTFLVHFSVNPITTEISLNLNYDPSQFSCEQVKSISGYYSTVLVAMVTQPEERYEQVCLLSEAERHQLLMKWNDTATEYPSDKCIHQLFEEQVEKTPDAVAVVFENQQLTYRQLNQRANQLAHYLQSLEVGSGVLVGICVEPSLEQVVSLLGTLKAGGAYVPLDPNYPQERLAFMLENSNVHVLLTQEPLTEKISPQHTHIVCLDRDRDAIGKESVENLDCQTTLDDLAYAIYTSGSTGKPKAVLGKLRGIVNRLHWMWETLPFGADEICCQKTSINFVDHVAEIFSPLLKGIPLVVVPEHIRGDISGLMSLLSDRKITRIVLVPSLLKAMLDNEPQQLSQLRYLKYVFCSGEALSLTLAEAFHQKLSSARLFNLYGSSEVAADVTCFEVNFWEIRQRILQYFKPEVVRGATENQVVGVHQKPFTKPGVSPEMLATKFQRSEFPSYPLTVDDYYDKLSQEVLPYAIDTGSPTFIGHMTSALPDFMHDMSKMISRLNQNLVKIETSKSLIFLEREAIAILHRLVYNLSGEFYEENIQQKKRNLGIITTGGTTANISALLCARNSGLLSQENSAELSKESLYKVLSKKGYHDVVIIGSRLIHYSLNKAASMLGLGTDNIVFIDSNDDGKLDLNLLKEKIRECRRNKLYILALVGIAGTTETGEIDPLFELGDIAQEFGIHFHVDAAWGGATIFSEKHKGKLKGINKADSLTICGHKQLYLPQGISVCLFKDPQMLNFAETTARYQAQRDTFDVGRFTIEGSRSAISLCLHGALHIIGKKGYEFLIDNGIEKAKYFARLIEILEPFELIMEPALNIVNYRYIPEDLRAKAQQKSLSDDDIQRINQLNTQIQREQFEQGLTFVSKTTLIDAAYGKDKEIVVFRAVLSNPNTTATDLQSVLEDQLRIANQIETRSQEKLDGLKNLPVERTGSSGTEAAVVKEAIHLQLADDPKADLGEALEDYLKKNTIPVGKPISNTQIYILDKDSNLLPSGVTGELYVGGDGLAQGYLNLPELTQEKFIPNPFVKDVGKSQKAEEKRLYRTGDLARWLPDGNIEFLGRLDHQVKIRGFRIELGEIEAVLNTHPKIQQAVVIATEDIASNKRLVAYIVTRNESLTNNQLREFLLSKLPEYMVPSGFVTLDTLPLTPNGKVDRKALPAPDGEISREHEYVAPRTTTEEIIANIFASVLGVPNVGIYDNFFELGGHSLLATQVISRLREAFLMELSLRSLFEKPTVAGISEQVENMRLTTQKQQSFTTAAFGKREEGILSIQPILPVPRDTTLPLSFAQQWLWFLEQLEPDNPFYNGHTAIQLTGSLDVAALEQSLNQIVQRHEALRTTFKIVEGQPVQIITPNLTLTLPVVNLCQLPEAQQQMEVQRLATEQSQRPFDLIQGPLLRFTLLQLGEQEHVLLLTMHHIIYDGWSLSVIVRELSALYQAFSTGKPSPLPELPIQYADFAVWQRQQLQGEKLSSQLSYWKQQLANAPPLLQLPTDRPRPPVQTYREARESFRLPKSVTQALQAIAQKAKATLFMTLLAAFKILLYRYSGQEDIIVGSAIANRNRAEIEGLIGFFVNTLVLRTDVSGNPTFEELLARVRQVTMGAYEHQDLPFEKLVEELQPERDANYNPLFQVAFTLQNTPKVKCELPGLTLTPVEVEQTRAWLDLRSDMDLRLDITETDSGLEGLWKYNTDLFDAATISRMSGHLQTLLEAIAAHPQQRVDQLPLLLDAKSLYQG